MASRLHQEAGVRELTAQYVLLKVETNVDGPDWTEWRKKYKWQGSAIPLVFVVRADGKQLYGDSGTPSELRAFLLKFLDQSGAILNVRQLAKMDQAIAKSGKLLEQNKTREAVGQLARFANSGSYAKIAVRVEELIDGFRKQARTRIEQADSQLNSDETIFAGAMALVETERLYGRLPDIKREINQRLGPFRKDKQKRPMLEQAELIDRARSYEESKAWKQAAARYRLAQKKFPDSPAAEYAAERIEKLNQHLTDKSADDAQSQSGKSKNDVEKKSQAYLRQAKTLLKKGSTKARNYLEKAIVAAPDSPAAKEARELLKKL